jgi:hypothetical protein
LTGALRSDTIEGCPGKWAKSFLKIEVEIK